MEIAQSFDPTTHNELLLAIQWYLAQGPCQESAAALRREIERFHLLPQRYDFYGIGHPQSLDRFERNIAVRQPSVVALIEKLNALVNISVPPVISNLPLRIFSSNRQSLCRNEEQKKRAPSLLDVMANKTCGSPNFAHTVQARQLGRRFPRHQMLPKEKVQFLGLHCRISGHLSSIFCVAFDRTGHFIFTGADDHLVKVWSSISGLLRFTLRGHSAQITDISVSDDNAFIASGSLDKTVRVWSLRSAASLACLRNHTAAVTLVTFLPYVYNQTRYLLSTGGDCVANFYRYSADDERFSNFDHICFNERASPGSRLVSSCCSPGGSLVVMGDTHRFLRIFRLSEDGVSKLKDIEAHTDRVDSLAWAHSGLKFVSGSKDGIAKVWKFQYSDWSAVVLDTKKRDEKTTVNSRRAYKVTMVCWTLEDDFVVTSGSDHALVVWDPNSGALLRQLDGHKEDTYVLIAHPLYREYVFSAGHDGLFMIWNVCEGILVKRYQNQEEVNGSVPLFDFSISPDGTVVAAVDSLGRLSIFGMGTSQKVKTTPKEQFFITDYMPVGYDDSGELIDEDTSIAPHLMPPPLLVDGDGNAYPEEVQRLIPGRDVLREDSINEGSVPEAAWLGRDLVQRLPASTVAILNRRLAALREVEIKEYSREACRRNPAAALEVEQMNRQPALRSRRGNTARGSARFPASRRAAQVEEREEEIALEEALPSNSSGDSTFDSASSLDEDESEITEDTSDSDYSIAEHPVSRSRKIERNNSVNSEETSSPRRSTRRRKRAFISSDIDGTDEVPAAGSSDEPETSCPQRRTRRSARSRRAKKRSVSSSSDVVETTASSSSAQPTSPVPGPSQNGDGIRATVTHRQRPVIDFPNWMRMVRPSRFPYIAQVGDVVVYFRQGHELYLNGVETLDLYPIAPRMKPLAQLDAEEMCLVTEVKYLRRPFRLISVKLARLDENETPTGLVFSVKYHDLENVPDFIILHRLYAESTSQIYEPGDRIESILDGHWWCGTIDKKEPYDETNFPRSHWYSLTVRWDTGEDEKMSPWDVQLINAERRTGLATDEEYFEYSFIPRLGVDWHCSGRSAEECEERLIEAIEALREEEDLRPFCVPVNLKDYPEYSLNVDYPIDLETIAKRAANKYYRRFASLEQDIKYIAINASMFNEPRSSIVHNSRALVETLLRYLKSSSYTDARALFSSLKGAPDSELIESKRPCRIKIPSVAEVGTMSTTSNLEHHLESAVTNFSAQEWILDCSRIVDTMSQSAFGRLLTEGGSDTLLAAVSDGCHSLTSILSNIDHHVYASPEQIVEDVQKLLQSYRALVDDKRSPYYLQSLNFSSRFNNSMAPILAKWQRFQQLSASTASSHENGVANGHHLRNRRKRELHVYNTRQRTNDESKPDENEGQSSLRSGRNARMPNGFYRDLNNGKHNAEDLSFNSRRKPRVKAEAEGPSNTYSNGLYVVADSVEPGRSGPSSPANRNKTRIVSSDDTSWNDAPGPSCSKSNGLPDNRVSKRRSKIPRSYKDGESRSEDEALADEEMGCDYLDGDFVMDEKSSDDEQNDVSDSSYTSEGAVSPTKRSGRSRKRRTNHDSKASGSSYTNGRPKRAKRHPKLRSSSPDGQFNGRERARKRKKRPGVSARLRSNRSVYIADHTPESGEVTDENNRRSQRPRRLRDKRINYNEDDEPEEEEVITSVSSRGRLRKQRSIR